MANLDPRFVIMPPLQEQIWDNLLNIPLAGGMVYFWEDDNRTIAKPVYELTGSFAAGYTYTELPNPLILSSIGTFVDPSGNQIIPYMFPYEGTPTNSNGTIENYFIEVYNSSMVLELTIQGWPNNTTTISASNTFGISDNIVSNPQFVQVAFNPNATMGSPVVISATGTNTATQIAPDWYMITTGTGSFSVYQAPNADTNDPTNPPYALGIVASTGFSTPLILRQRLFNTPRIFANEYVSGTFVAAALDGIGHILTLSYVPSATGTPQTIVTGTTTISGFTAITGAAVLIDPPNTGAPPSAYIDITITIPLGAEVLISSVQIVGVQNSAQSVTYLESTSQRQIDQLFHYYQPMINYKPTKSWLVGWDFPLNPAQFGISGSLGSIGANSGAYAWDQTIIFQTVTNTVSYGTNSNGDLVVLMTGTGQFALIQYLAAPEITTFLGRNMSVGGVLASTSAPTATISLWYTTNAHLPNVASGSNLTFITALDANGHPSGVVSGWTEISRGNYGNAAFTTPTSINSQSVANIGFYGWGALTTPVAASATYFAIVIGFSSMTSSQAVEFNALSLVSGDIPTIPGAQSANDVLSDCQYFYEQSYQSASVVGTSTAINAQFYPMSAFSFVGTTTAATYASPLTIDFREPKIKPPNMSIYSVSGSSGAGNVQAALYYSNTGNAYAVSVTDVAIGTFWTFVYSNNNCVFIPKVQTVLNSTNSSSASNPFASAGVYLQYIADSRLGIVL
jgi:hypothetical protein